LPGPSQPARGPVEDVPKYSGNTAPVNPGFRGKRRSVRPNSVAASKMEG